MKIGILSDTHLDRVAEDFKSRLFTLFHGVDIIIHAGDMTARVVYDYLCNWDLRAVRGNMDDHDLAIHLPEKRVEEIGGRRIGIIHGRGSPQGLENLVYREFEGVDVIVFGHSHVPLHIKMGKTLLFNPGSYRGFSTKKGTVGIMEIDEIDQEIRLSHREVV